MINVNTRCIKSLLLATGFLLSALASASTILKVSFEEVAVKSELIFEGRVIAKQTRPSPNNGRPFTYFTFEILEVLKGTAPGKTIELGFAGGTMNNVTMSISDLHMPSENETGIYFVENTSKELFHPLYGWSQGHYLVKPSATSSSKVINADSNAKADTALTSAPSVSEFKQKVRNIVGGAL